MFQLGHKGWDTWSQASVKQQCTAQTPGKVYASRLGYVTPAQSHAGTNEAGSVSVDFDVTITED